LTYSQDAANVLFHVVHNRHLRKRPMIFTTNKPLIEWGQVLHDEDLAAAILDRVLERGRLIRLDGPSGRTRHLKLEEPLPGTTDRFRISGNNGSEFPEPTTRRITASSHNRRGTQSVGCAVSGLEVRSEVQTFANHPGGEPGFELPSSKVKVHPAMLMKTKEWK
jgi:hypothetical protein